MRAATCGNPGSVVGDVSDALERHAKPFGDELRETGLVALSRGHGAHYQLDSAFRKHGDFGALAWSTARDLDVIRDADTSQLAVLSRCGLAGCKSIPIGERPCRVHRVLVAAAVVGDAKRVGVCWAADGIMFWRR